MVSREIEQGLGRRAHGALDWALGRDETQKETKYQDKTSYGPPAPAQTLMQYTSRPRGPNTARWALKRSRSRHEQYAADPRRGGPHCTSSPAFHSPSCTVPSAFVYLPHPSRTPSTYPPCQKRTHRSAQPGAAHHRCTLAVSSRLPRDPGGHAVCAGSGRGRRGCGGRRTS